MGVVRGVLGVCLVFLVAAFGGCGGQSASDGDGGGSVVPPPACLKALFASCELQGACTAADVNGDGTVGNSCFGHGVKVVSTKGTECGNVDDAVYKNDGSVCFTRSSFAVAGHACEGGTVTWKDSAGAVVATEHASLDHALSVSCTDTGQETACEGNTCAWDALSTLTCKPGACP